MIDRLFSAALVAGFAMVIGVNIGVLVAERNMTPASVPVIAGFHCWQGWNEDMPKHHELICAKAQL